MCVCVYVWGRGQYCNPQNVWMCISNIFRRGLVACLDMSVCGEVECEWGGGVGGGAEVGTLRLWLLGTSDSKKGKREILVGIKLYLFTSSLVSRSLPFQLH